MRILKLFLLLCFLPLCAHEECTSENQTEVILVADQEKIPESKEVQQAPQETPEEAPEIHKATESYEAAFIKTIVVLVGLLVLVILTIWMFKKLSHGRLRSFNTLKSIKILEKRPLSPKSILYLIEVSGKQVLIAESQLEVRNIATLDWLGSDKDL